MNEQINNAFTLSSSINSCIHWTSGLGRRVAIKFSPSFSLSTVSLSLSIPLPLHLSFIYLSSVKATLAFLPIHQQSIKASTVEAGQPTFFYLALYATQTPDCFETEMLAEAESGILQSLFMATRELPQGCGTCGNHPSVSNDAKPVKPSTGDTLLLHQRDFFQSRESLKCPSSLNNMFGKLPRDPLSPILIQAQFCLTRSKGICLYQSSGTELFQI